MKSVLQESQQRGILIKSRTLHDSMVELAKQTQLKQCRQWRRYTRVPQVKWPGWEIHRPGSALPICFGLLRYSVNRKYKMTADRFICFILTVKQSQRRWRPLCFGRRLKKEVVNFFEKKSTSGWPGSRMFWPQNDLASLLRWHRHCVQALLPDDGLKIVMLWMVDGDRPCGKTSKMVRLHNGLVRQP